MPNFNTIGRLIRKYQQGTGTLPVSNEATGPLEQVARKLRSEDTYKVVPPRVSSFYGVPVGRDREVYDPELVRQWLDQLGYPGIDEWGFKMMMQEAQDPSRVLFSPLEEFAARARRVPTMRVPSASGDFTGGR